MGSMGSMEGEAAVSVRRDYCARPIGATLLNVLLFSPGNTAVARGRLTGVAVRACGLPYQSQAKPIDRLDCIGEIHGAILLPSEAALPQALNLARFNPPNHKPRHLVHRISTGATHDHKHRPRPVQGL